MFSDLYCHADRETDRQKNAQKDRHTGRHSYIKSADDAD